MSLSSLQRLSTLLSLSLFVVTPVPYHSLALPLSLARAFAEMAEHNEGTNVILFAAFALLLGVICRSAVVSLKLPIPYTVHCSFRRHY